MIIEAYIIFQISALVLMGVALFTEDHIISSLAFIFFLMVMAGSVNIVRTNCFEIVNSTIQNVTNNVTITNHTTNVLCHNFVFKEGYSTLFVPNLALALFMLLWTIYAYLERMKELVER